MNSVNNNLPLKAHGEYVREVKNLLPPKAFTPAPQKLFFLGAYFLLLMITYFLFRYYNNIVGYLLLSFLATHCLSCIGFLAHELSHHAIVRNKRIRYPLEVIAWGINLIPATMWDKVHNHTHHTHTNTPEDPDRLYFVAEKTKSTSLYTKIFYAHKKGVRWNPVVLSHFIPYIFRNILSVFYPKNNKPSIVPFKPKYSREQKRLITAELVVVILFQAGIFYLVGKSMLAYFFAGPLSYVFTSAIFNVYIYTNHFLNTVNDEHDPVLGTTTVEVPAILNKLHFNFAYHTEHHLFPSMNSKYFPELSRILREKYPERYNYLMLGEAWKRIWNNDDFITMDEAKQFVPET